MIKFVDISNLDEVVGLYKDMDGFFCIWCKGKSIRLTYSNYNLMFEMKSPVHMLNEHDAKQIYKIFVDADCDGSILTKSIFK